MIKIELSKAYECGEAEPVKVLELEEIKTKHIRDLKLQELRMGDFLDIAQRASNYPRTLFDMLDIEDGMKVMNELGKRFGGGLETGESA